MASRRFILASIVMCALSSARYVDAEPRTGRLAIESYVGPRPPEAVRVMAALRPILEANGFTANTELVKQLSEHVSRPGLADPRAGQVLSKKIETGVNQFINLDYERAVALLEAALALAKQNPIVVVREPRNRDAVMRGRLYLALAYGRQSADPKYKAPEQSKFAARRDAAMTELIRSFPSKVITSKEFGQEAEQLADRVRRELDKTGRGRLEVTVNGEPDAVIYVDGTHRGQGRATIGDLVPGPHDVLIDAPSGDSRQYETNVMSSQETRLLVEWDVDSLLVARDWVGFAYPGDTERAREAELVRRLARQSTTAVMVAVFNTKRVNRRIIIAGTLYGVAAGKRVRGATVELAGHDDEMRLAHLVVQLLGQGTFPEVTVVGSEALPSPSPVDSVPEPTHTPTAPMSARVAPLVPPETKRDGHSYVLPGIMVGSGLAAIAAGTYLSLTADPDPGGAQEQYVYSVPGLALAAGGGLVAIVGGYLVYRASKSRSRSTPTAGLARHGAVLGWSRAF